jgi:mRNA-degrading endonuclease YafQ of YafQ-DinJ toxin-antitoxin module
MNTRSFKKDLEYHRKSAKSHQRQMELILRNLEQRNFIEAKDKKLE